MKSKKLASLTGLLVAVTLATSLAAPVCAAETKTSETQETQITQEIKPETVFGFCTDEELDAIQAMEISDPATRAKRDNAVKSVRSVWCAGLLKRYYMQKGPNLTFVLGIYFIPSPIVYEIVQVIEKEIESGDRSYIYAGVFYESPEKDPTFNDYLNNKK